MITNFLGHFFIPNWRTFYDIAALQAFCSVTTNKLY